MFDTKWYAKIFIPLIAEAASKKVTMSRERFIQWVYSNKDRKCKHAGIEYFVNDFDDKSWDEAVAEAVELA